MPSCPRREIFDPDVIGVYHCTNRCGRRRPLCGRDPQTKVDCSHRKQWIIDKIRELQAIFLIDVLSLAILSNHFHCMLRNRPDLVEKASDREIARRRLLCCPLRKDEDGKAMEPTEQEIDQILATEGEIEKWRERLSSISWYMKFLKEPIAKRANREDEVTGHFWEGRFHCVRLLDALAVLMCTMYVDLNEIRAGIAFTPEESKHTSIFFRIQAWYEHQLEHGNLDDDEAVELSLDKILGCELPTDSEPAPNWLSPINEQSRSGDIELLMTNEQPVFGQPRPSNLGFLPMTLTDYFSLCDWAGREAKRNKRGKIPGQLEPIMDRLVGNLDVFLDAVQNFGTIFRRFCGSPKKLAEHRNEEDALRYHGSSTARTVYAPT